MASVRTRTELVAGSEGCARLSSSLSSVVSICPPLTLPRTSAYDESKHLQCYIA